MKEKIIITGSFIALLAVIAGALGAHLLEGSLSSKNMEIWRTGVLYHFFHAFAILFLSTLSRFRLKAINECYYLFIFGIICFSGSLYLLACRDLLGLGWAGAVLGPLTPLGGLLFITGWGKLMIAAYKHK